MQSSKIVFIINDSVLAVKARYEDGATADTFKTFDQNLRIGDLVVVQSGTRHGMTVAKISEIDVEPDLESPVEIKWIVSKIDAAAFDRRIEDENEAIATVQAAERARKKAELRKTMFGSDHDKVDALKLAYRGDDDLVEPAARPE